MQFLKGQEKTGASRWLLPFLTGFVVGVLLWNFGGAALTEKSGLLDEYTLGRIRSMELNYHAFFWYVLQKRIGMLWLLAMVSSTFAGIYLLYAYTVWLGAAGGILLSASVIRYGFRGILLVIAGCLPQYLFYLPAIVGMLCIGYSFCVKLYYPSRDTGYSCYNGSNRKSLLVRYFLLFLSVHLVVIIGTVMESYVNPILVTRLLQIF
ncbi:MAG: hypothetical protein GX234_10525 [Clostridiales bacterium]|nr:hypothetical protein [Clostridiales bacterium]